MLRRLCLRARLWRRTASLMYLGRRREPTRRRRRRSGSGCKSPGDGASYLTVEWTTNNRLRAWRNRPSPLSKPVVPAAPRRP
uniref:Secreted protein n=1 Tax=Mycena chlorophos TaxID=658473 RepID=A0ABQ0LJN7_MYCCL|nr:predicted protein [Mycena chlorophos]